MNSLKPGPLASDIIPGAFAIGLILLLWRFASAPIYRSSIYSVASAEGTSALLRLGGAIALAWVIGTFIDAIRNAVVEPHIDKCWPQIAIGPRWEFFFKGKPPHVGQFDQYYFSPYRIDANISIAIALTFGFELILKIAGLLSGISFTQYSVVFSVAFHLVLLVCLLVFVMDAISLRREMANCLRSWYDNQWPEYYG